MPAKDEYISGLFKSHLATAMPEFLYHYTSQAGLIGIVQNSELWATKVHYMNDSTEFSLALDLARDVITEGWGATEILGDVNSLPPRAKVAKQIWYAIDRITKVNIFVACFCEQSDLLSQWRGYSHGSYGYSVGFNAGKLALRATSGSFPFFLGKCIYDQN
jgi:hypothetical protein